MMKEAPVDIPCTSLCKLHKNMPLQSAPFGPLTGNLELTSDVGTTPHFVMAFIDFFFMAGAADAAMQMQDLHRTQSH